LEHRSFPPRDNPALPGAPLHILLTNDDGFSTPGIQLLRDALLAAGHFPVIVAPRTDQSGRGTSVFSHFGGKLNLQFHSAENAWSVNGSPVDAVRVALDILHLSPDLVIAGINLGENLGPIATSSGTVGASLYALQAGYPAIAVSAGLLIAEARLTPPFPSSLQAMRSAASLVAQLANRLSVRRQPGKALLPAGAGVNINYPAAPNPRPPVITQFSRGYTTFTVGLKPDADFDATGNIVLDVRILPAPPVPDPANDAEMFAAGHITLTPLNADWTAPADGFHALIEDLAR
jgi:5'/3'-nucleotidase SurE